MLPPPAAHSARRLRKILCPLIEDAAKRSEADRYRKSFPAFAHVWMLLLHAMSANQSLRQSHAQSSRPPTRGCAAGLRRRLGMDGWISFS
jgi:hypothetical protein